MKVIEARTNSTTHDWYVLTENATEDDEREAREANANLGYMKYRCRMSTEAQ